MVGLAMSDNVLEDQVSEYLRYNGFFLIRGFVIHFEDAQAQEIDFVGVRLPKSVEQTAYSNGRYSNFVFKDDDRRLELSSSPEIILLVAQATESDKRTEITKRIGKLRDTIRISYALQRLGVIENEDIEKLLNEETINYSEGIRARLLRLLFVLNDQIVTKYQKENNDISFISQSNVLSFIEERSKIDIKSRAKALLPRWLHYFVDKLKHR